MLIPKFSFINRYANFIVTGLIVLLLSFGTSTRTFSQACNNERIYVQTDKENYVAGETIFFKTYIFTKFSPDDVATMLKISLFGEQNKLISTQLFPISQGVSFGTVDIPATLKEGGYLLKAHIKRNEPVSDTTDGYEKPLFVINPNEQQTRQSFLDSAKNQPYHVNIMPNAGKLIDGLVNQVYYTITGDFGMIIPNATGKLYNANSEEVASLSGGKGQFAFIPHKGERYYLTVSIPGSATIKMFLSDVVDNQLLVNAAAKPGTALINLQIPAGLQSAGSATVLGMIDRNVVFKKEIQLAKSEYSLNIPTADLPASMLDVVVVNAAQKILGFHSVFINPGEAMLPVHLQIDSLNVKPGGMNQFSIRLADTIQMMSDVSVAVTDADKILAVPSPNIFSELLIKHQDGVLNQNGPMMNVLPDSTELIKFAAGTTFFNDNVLAVNAAAQRKCNLPDTNIIHIGGTVVFKKSGKPVVKGEIKFVFSNQDSGINVITTPIENNGRFNINKLIFQGVGRFRYALNAKNPDDILIHLDTVVEKIDAKLPYQRFLPFYAALNQDMSVKKKADDRFNEINLPTHTTLAPVTVNARKIKPIQRVNDKYASGLFQNLASSRNLDFINDPIPPTGGNILDYLQARMNGLVITNLGGGQYQINSNRTTSFSGPAAVKSYIDEQESPVSSLINIPVRDVALVKYFPPGTSQIGGGAFVGILAVYTRKWDDYPETDRPGYQSFVVKGFTNSKEPESLIPDASIAASDTRTTLYWNPQVLLDKVKPSFQIRFPNTATAKRFLVKIEGFSPDGKLVHFEKLIE